MNLANLWNKFVEAVTEHFRYLEEEFNFVRTLTKVPNVIYESDKLQMQIFYDVEGRFELDLALRRLPDTRMSLSFGIDMLMYLQGLADATMSPFPSTPEELEFEVKRLAEDLRKYGAALLGGDLRDFDRMEQIEREFVAKLHEGKNE